MINIVMIDTSDVDNFDDHFEDVTSNNVLESGPSIHMSEIVGSSTFETPSLGDDSMPNGDTVDGMTSGLPNHHGQSDSKGHYVFHQDNNGQDNTHIDLSDIDGNHANEISFKGTPQERAEWAKKAQSEKEWVNFYNKEADSCLIHNDINGYNKNLALAKKHAEYYDKYIANSKR